MLSPKDPEKGSWLFRSDYFSPQVDDQKDPIFSNLPDVQTSNG